MRCSTPSWSFVRFLACTASGQCNLLVVLVHLLGVAVIVTVGRHHHGPSFCEGEGHRLALTATAPSHRTLIDASQLTAQRLPNRNLRATCGLWSATG